MSGVEILERIKSLSPTTACIMITAVDEVRTARERQKREPAIIWSNPFPGRIWFPVSSGL